MTDEQAVPDGFNRLGQEAEEARAYLKEHASEIQKKLDEDTGEKAGLYLCWIIREDGEPAMFTTRNDELIIEYYKSLTTDPIFAALIEEGKRLGTG